MFFHFFFFGRHGLFVPLPDNVASLKCACAVCTRIRYRSRHIPIYNSFLLSFFSETPLLVSILRYLLFFCTVILCLQMLEVNKNERKKTRVECEMLQCYRRNQQKVLEKKTVQENIIRNIIRWTEIGYFGMINKIALQCPHDHQILMKNRCPRTDLNSNSLALQVCHSISFSSHLSNI